MAARAKDTLNCLQVFDSDRGWTNLMMEVLSRTGLALEFPRESQGREYLRLDLAFFSYPNRPDDGTDDLWNLEVAIEHENHSERWFDEWVKLRHIACGLKVLIAYHDYRSGDPQRKLDKAQILYDGLSYRPRNEALLLILGPTCYTPDKAWLGYTMQCVLPASVQFP